MNKVPLTPREVALRQAAFTTAVGKATEDRFYAAFHDSHARLPVWLQGMRRANGLNDSEGVDFFAITDTGEIPVQIKSSARWIEEYRRKHPNSKAVILVIHQAMTAEEIRVHTCKHLSPLRLAGKPRDWRNPAPIKKTTRT